MVVIGIDLGTTFCCCGVYNSENGTVTIIPNEFGNRITPSYVSFMENERIVGDIAKQNVSKNYQNTIFDIKRIIGRKFSDEGLQNDLKHFPYKVICGDNDNPLIQINYKNEIKIFTPEEISAMILNKLKKNVEDYFGKPIDGVVITVPAYFNDAQRNATINAGKLANLNVLRIINEPTAAAIAYGLDQKKENKVLIFDYGGGTFDTSVLIIENGYFEVKATNGDTRCGGEDIDNKLIMYCLSEFCKINKLSSDKIKELISDGKIKRKLRTECENAKKILSSVNETCIVIDCFYNDIDLSIKINKSKMEELCIDLFNKLMIPVQKVLNDANIKKEEIDDIVLVGGSTRIPKIRDMLYNYFGKEPKKDINPDEAVAYGAAIQAFKLSGQYDFSGKTSDLILLDVIPLSLGIETVGGVMTKIIEKNTSKPHTKEQVFSTFSDNQTNVIIKIYEGERMLVKDNNLLGTFELTGITAAPRGVPRIKIIFDIDVNGILNVTAIEESSGKSKKIFINSDQYHLTKEDIQKKLIDADKNSEQDKELYLKIYSKNLYEQKLYNIKNTFDDIKFRNKFSDEKLKEFTIVLKEYTLWINKYGNESSNNEINEKRVELENHYKNFIDSGNDLDQFSLH